MTVELESDAIEPRRFRDVLGNFPTGVAVITSRDLAGAPIGMAVGSFTSVSLAPPLVAFLPDQGSSTFPLIRQAGRFCVNILSSEQAALCRNFATRGADRFQGVQWEPAPRTGSPILDGVVAWIDCDLDTVHDAGDHHIAIGRVLDLGIDRPTVPLVFFQGGYGTFAPRSLVLASRGRPTEAVRVAESARQELEELAATTGLECRVFARDQDGMVIVATAGATGRADPVGAILPSHPPFGAPFAASESPAERAAWYESLGLAPEQRAALDISLDMVRDNGWMLTYNSPAASEAESLVEAMATNGRTPALERQLLDIAKRMSGIGDPDRLDESTAHEVRTITAPVMGPNGPLLCLTLFRFPSEASLDFVEHARRRVIEVARRISERTAPLEREGTATR